MENLNSSNFVIVTNSVKSPRNHKSTWPVESSDSDKSCVIKVKLVIHDRFSRNPCWYGESNVLWLDISSCTQTSPRP